MSYGGGYGAPIGNYGGFGGSIAAPISYGGGYGGGFGISAAGFGISAAGFGNGFDSSRTVEADI
jgi:hypothetical protein